MQGVEEVAKQLGVSPATVRGLIRTGELKAYRIGKQVRIAEEDVKAYLAAQVIVPKGKEPKTEDT